MRDDVCRNVAGAPPSSPESRVAGWGQLGVRTQIVQSEFQAEIWKSTLEDHEPLTSTRATYKPLVALYQLDLVCTMF